MQFCHSSLGRATAAQKQRSAGRKGRFEAHLAIGVLHCLHQGISLAGGKQVTLAANLLERPHGRQRYPGVTRSGVVRHSDLDLRMLPCAPQQRRKVDPGSAYPHRQVLDAVFAPQGQP